MAKPTTPAPKKASKPPMEPAVQEFLIRVGERLRDARRSKGESMLDVAMRFGYTKAAVGHWETGKNPIDVRMLFTLARFYGTTVFALVADDLTGDDAAALIKRQIDAAAAKAAIAAPQAAVSARGDRFLALPAAPAVQAAPPASQDAKRRARP